ncbi:MAG: hypothetical protein EAZ42_12760 [Verrucomicrobia bacterium]|nr:MAG: hypothetical protein EAZ42_12760 [Verrucomicrobiota bacterium]
MSLNPSQPIAESPPQLKRRRKLRIFLWLVLAITVALLIWGNGPGFRLLLPAIARAALKPSNTDASFTVRGSLLGGWSLHQVKLSNHTTFGELSIDSFTPDFKPSALLSQPLEKIHLDKIHLDLHIHEKAEENPLPIEQQIQLALEKIPQNRAHFLPIDLQITDLTLRATKEGKLVFNLESSQLNKRLNADEFLFDLGAMTDGMGRIVPAQKSSLIWKSDSIRWARLQLTPAIGLSDLLVTMPPAGQATGQVLLSLNDAQIEIKGEQGFNELKVKLLSGQLDIDAFLASLGISPVVQGNLTACSLSLTGLLGDPDAIDGQLQLELDDAVYQQVMIPEFNLRLSKAADAVDLDVQGEAMGSPVAITAKTNLLIEKGQWQPAKIEGNLKIAEVSKVMDQLSSLTTSLDPLAPFPASSIDADFSLMPSSTVVDSASGILNLTAQDGQIASPLRLEWAWQKNQPITLNLQADQLSSEVKYDSQKTTYDAKVSFNQFQSARVQPWLRPFKLNLDAALIIDADWSGSGDLTQKNHQGNLQLRDAALKLLATPTHPEKVYQASGKFQYDWPKKLNVEGLSLKHQKQIITANLNLLDQQLKIENLSWKDQNLVLAEGRAQLPVPENFSKWREFLASEKSPLQADIVTGEIPFSYLSSWVPALASLDPNARGKVSLKIAGTYAQPRIEAEVLAKELRSPQQPDLPTTDLKIDLLGEQDVLTIKAAATARDLPPAVVSFRMPFRVNQWANDRSILMAETIELKADLPRLELARFQTLVPQLKRLGGTTTGNIVGSGTLQKPLLKGTLKLADGIIELKNDQIPAITSINAQIDADASRIALTSMTALVGGGKISADGSLNLANRQPTNVNLRIKLDHIPVVRNESMLVRANAVITCAGPWQAASVTGNVGLVDGIFYRDVEIIPMGMPMNLPAAATLPKVEAPRKLANALPLPFRNWPLRVNIRTDDLFLIRGNIATGEARAALTVGGTLGNLLPDGQVQLKNFRASLPFSTLLIPSGKIDFTPSTGWDGLLEIRGTSEPRPYRVVIYAYGRMSNPQLVMSSSPPLPDNEIMTLLATGATTSGLEDPQAASARAMQLLIEELRRGRFLNSRRLRPVLKLLDRVDFTLADQDPYSTESFSSATLQLHDRWYLSTGLGGMGDARTLLIWRLAFR